ncbi:exonuclease SbcCD subunit D [Chloroflexota bacterium]
MNQEKKPVRIIHTSDIHLGDYGLVNNVSLEIRSQRALEAMTNLCIQGEVSMVIFAGDLFDHNRVDTAIVESALGELRKMPVPVLILPGNHDCLVEDSVYRRPYFSQLAPNITVFTAQQGERFSFPELDLAVWGKPITSHDGGCRPMAGIPPRGSERWQIAVAHGYYVTDWTEQIYSYQITEEEIVQSHQDYVALGHSTVFRCVCDSPVKACYSGSASLSGAAVIIDLHPEAGVHTYCQQLPL